MSCIQIKLEEDHENKLMFQMIYMVDSSKLVEYCIDKSLFWQHCEFIEQVAQLLGNTEISLWALLGNDILAMIVQVVLKLPWTLGLKNWVKGGQLCRLKQCKIKYLPL